MDRPIFLIGAARSGTKIIGATLGRHPDVAFWDEPKYVWRHGAHGRPDDVRGGAEATPRVAGFIRERFAAYARGQGRPRFLEKTPSNCFRVPFMAKVFPEGLFLHVLRDGRSVAASALQRWCSQPDDAALARRLRGFEVPLHALHHYVPDILRELVLRRLKPRRGYLWGPRYPDLLREYRSGTDVATLCARQWAESVRWAQRDLAALPRGQVFTFRYESLVRRPASILGRIREFTGLRAAPELDAAMGELREDRGGAWASLSAGDQEIIAAICDPLTRGFPAVDAEPDVG